MHNFRLCLYLIFGLTLSETILANTTVTSVGINSAYVNSSGNVVSMQTFRAQYAGKPDSYYSKAVTYNKATTGKLGKAGAFFKGNSLNLGIVAATLGIGYFLDYVTKDIYTTAPVPQQPLSGAVFCRTDEGVTRCSSSGLPLASHYFKTYSNPPPYTYGIVRVREGSEFACASPTNPGTCYYSQQYYHPTYGHVMGEPVVSLEKRQTLTGNEVNANPGSSGTPATHEQIHDAIFPSDMYEQNGYLGNNLPDLLRDPQTGAVEQTQEVQDAMTEVANQHNQSIDPNIPLESSPTVDPDYTETPNEPPPSSQPAFCAWASTVCDFINWFKQDTVQEPDQSPIQEQQLTYETQDWTSGLSNGTCPSPNSISVLGGSFEISYQPFCDLAGMIKYLVLALAYLTSAMIISGVKK